MEAAAPRYLLPRPPNITPELRCFLDARFRSPADLAAAADVEAEIRGRCAELEASVSDLSIQLVDATTAYSSSLGSALCGVRGDLAALKVSTSEPGVREDVDVGSEKMLYGQLPALANEVASEDVKMSPLGVGDFGCRSVGSGWTGYIEILICKLSTLMKNTNKDIAPMRIVLRFQKVKRPNNK